MPKKLNPNKNNKMPKATETVLEIDMGALAHNYHFLRSKINPDVKFMSVVKAYAYGSDSEVIAQKLQDLGTDYFAVAYVYEGIRLRKAGITKPILILHPQASNFDAIIENCLEPNLYSKAILQTFIKIAEGKKQSNYPIHLKLNTGMNRLGFSEKEIPQVFELISSTSSIKVASIMSHLAASEDWQEREFTLGQINKFRKMSWQLIEKLGYEPLLHICNTSGVLNYPKAVFSMVRSGIGLYGFGNDEAIDPKLKPIGTLKSIISQIHVLEKNDTVGYNRSFIAQENTKIAILPIGHADGISRIYGHEKAGVYLNGKYAPIIGNVCMDIIMINVTNINCKEGDEVIIFGDPQHAASLAKAGNTISYELITGISQRVTRKIIS